MFVYSNPHMHLALQDIPVLMCSQVSVAPTGAGAEEPLHPEATSGAEVSEVLSPPAAGEGGKGTSEGGAAEASAPSLSPVWTPPPKPSRCLESSLSKVKHSTYKSRNVGFFCWDCKKINQDIGWFREQPCLPAGFKTPLGDDEDPYTPKKGEAAELERQLKIGSERNAKMDLLRRLREEEAYLDTLLAKKKCKEAAATPSYCS